ncbi:helix-turn-helix domain-containing protein [Campylobacter hyointestinalis]|uniref:helix-turn-helix domain-containing protein n=1 Tax=Campylobacter hyointestinalis TaxID=198 RepID=UPI000726F7CC|nr:helix-turn-helix domain-containing protein [Campylobacter hyointestinalis]CUU82556.1 Uncharacterised protein [Campylobacter hyointestinalis subsp. hyointestinalis]
MQTDYLFNAIKGFKKFKEFGYTVSMRIDEAQHRLKIINFYLQYGLKATLDAFSISKRTLYRWQSLYNKGGSLALNPKSKRPKRYRVSSFDRCIVKEIKRLRTIYPNICKDRLYYLLRPYCMSLGIKLPSVSSIGRIISCDKDRYL